MTLILYFPEIFQTYKNNIPLSLTGTYVEKSFSRIFVSFIGMSSG